MKKIINKTLILTFAFLAMQLVFNNCFGYVWIDTPKGPIESILSFLVIMASVIGFPVFFIGLPVMGFTLIYKMHEEHKKEERLFIFFLVLSIICLAIIVVVNIVGSKIYGTGL